MKAHKEVKNIFGGNYKQFFEITEEKRPVKLPTHLTLKWYEDLEQIRQPQTPHQLSSSNSGGSPSLGGTPTPSRSDLAEDAGSSVTDLISSPENSPSPDPTQYKDPAVPYQTHSSESTELLFQQIAQGPATPNRTDVAQDLAVPKQTHSSESTDLLFEQMTQDPATPSRAGITQSLCSTTSPHSTQFQDPAVPCRTQSSESTDLVFQRRAQDSATPNRIGVPQVVQAVDPKLHAGGESDAVCLNHAPCASWTLESMDKFLQSEDCCCLRTCRWISPWALHNVENLYQFFATDNLGITPESVERG